MKTTHESACAPRLRPLAAALATLCAASTAAWDTHAALALPHAPTNIVVGNCNDSGTGSLRAALNSAVSDDTVDLTQLSCSKITLTTGALVFGQLNLTIVGPGRNQLAIDGGNSGAVLYHLGNGTLRVNGVSIINGQKYRSDGNVAGACVHANSNLRLENVTVSHCKTTGGGSRSAFGGAVWAQGYAVIVGSTISDSSAVANGSGDARGGGLHVLDELYMRRSTIMDNVASSHVVGKGFGGGVVALGAVNIIESTISANHADNFGGADLNAYGGNVAANIINSTVSGNTATVVGGVFALDTLKLYNSTIAFNTSSVWALGANGQHYAAGVHVSVASQLTMHSTIISNNVNMGAPSATADLTAPAGVGFTGGHNNVMNCDGACPSDTTNEDPGLHPLRDNGGPTRTHVPTPGPWHTSAGSNVRHLIWEQRGNSFPRESDGDPIEIGALQTNSGIVFVNGFN